MVCVELSIVITYTGINQMFYIRLVYLFFYKNIRELIAGIEKTDLVSLITSIILEQPVGPIAQIAIYLNVKVGILNECVHQL